MDNTHFKTTSTLPSGTWSLKSLQLCDLSNRCQVCMASFSCHRNTEIFRDPVWDFFFWEKSSAEQTNWYKYLFSKLEDHSAPPPLPPLSIMWDTTGLQDKSLPKETLCQKGFTSKFLKSDLLQNRKQFLAPCHKFMGCWRKKQFQPRFGLPYCGMFYSEPLLSVRTLQSVQPQSPLV